MERHAASTEVSYTALTGLQELIEETVTSGEMLPPQLKEIKRVCRTGGDECIRTAHKCLMQHLEREHAQIRLVCFELIDQLFSRSQLFRKLMIDAFKQFVALCVGLDDIHAPLPPPLSFAKQLRYRSLRFVHEANEKWGAEHKQIQLAYNHLRRTQKVNFRSIVQESRREQQATEDRARRKQQSHKGIYDRVERELKGCRRDVDSVLAQLDECLPMVVPRFDLRGVAADLADLRDIADTAEHVEGLAPSTEELTITVSTDNRVDVYESEDNQVLVQTIRDNYKRLLRTHRPWVEATLLRLQRNIDPRATALLPSMVTLKSHITTTMERCDELRIIEIEPASPAKAGAAGTDGNDGNAGVSGEMDSDSESDDELEEVGAEKEGYEPSTLPLDPGPPTATVTAAAGLAAGLGGTPVTPSLGGGPGWADDSGLSLPAAPNDASAAAPTSEELGLRRMRELGLLPPAAGDASAAGPAAQPTARPRQKRKKPKSDALVDPKRDTNTPTARLIKKLKRKKK